MLHKTSYIFNILLEIVKTCDLLHPVSTCGIGFGVCVVLLLNVPWGRQKMISRELPAQRPVVSGELPAQRPVTRSFDVFFDLHPNKRLSKQWWGWWF